MAERGQVGRHLARVLPDAGGLGVEVDPVDQDAHLLTLPAIFLTYWWLPGMAARGACALAAVPICQRASSCTPRRLSLLCNAAPTRSRGLGSALAIVA
jgi:hypothetical protein